MEVISSTTNSIGNNPLGAGFAGLINPVAATQSIMGDVAEQLSGNNNSADIKFPTPSILNNVEDTTEDVELPEPKSLEEALARAKENGEVETAEKKGGRPKTDKNIAINYIAERAKDGKIALFSDYDESVEVEEYLSKLPQSRLYELFDKNLEDARTSAIQELQESERREWYDSLPDTFKAMYDYAANGGNDWSVFAQTMQNQQYMAQLDPSNEDHQAIIAQNYLEATGFGTPDMIQEQIQEWQSDGKIGNKAAQFKPMLDNMYQQETYRLAQEQQAYAMQMQQEAKQFQDSVYQTLSKGEIAGIKLSKEQQREFFKGLTTTSEQWGNTNELEHLWEKTNFVDKDYNKLTMVHWLLKDTEGFLNAVRQQGANGQANKDFDQLKRLNVKGTGGSNIAEVPTPKNIKKFSEPSMSGLFNR